MNPSISPQLPTQTMIRFPRSMDAWGRRDFEAILKDEIEGMDAGQLPLQQGLSATSYALGGKVKAMVIGASDEGGFIRARAGIFYSGIVAGCSCADDPTPVEPQSEYCEVQLDIDKATAETTVTLLGD